MNFFGNSFAANGLQIRELTQIQVLNLTETRQQINYNSEKTGLSGGKEKLNIWNGNIESTCDIRNFYRDY
ncbi:MAG: hypothetical protein V7K70_16055 [Nostoc sp.]